MSKAFGTVYFKVKTKKSSEFNTKEFPCYYAAIWNPITGRQESKEFYCRGIGFKASERLANGWVEEKRKEIEAAGVPMGTEPFRRAKCPTCGHKEDK